jgi:dTDP-4-amino-4,6-dideoxygalactose transaminase
VDNPKIPFLDLVTPSRELKSELTAVFDQALETAGFIGGPMLEDFERNFARFCQAQYCVGVASGTDALRFALMAAGVKDGDVVVTVPNTFIATTEAISQAGATPDFVDVDEQTYNIDPAKLERYLVNECRVEESTGRLINKRLEKPVTAVIPVHLYGQPADMDRILELAERFKLIVIEDACQAHGAEYFSKRQNRWLTAGSMGRAAAFSFYPGKNLGAFGEAGAVTTNDAELAKKIQMLRDHGQSRKYHHDVEGYNGRLDAIQAGILRVKLRKLAEWNEKRRQAAARYATLFFEEDRRDLPPVEPTWTKSVYHLYVVRVQDRDGAIAHLAEAGIGTGIHYPVPLHLQKAYQHLGLPAGSFPVAELYSSQILSLPMFPQLTAEQQARVVKVLISYMQRTGEVSGEFNPKFVATPISKFAGKAVS